MRMLGGQPPSLVEVQVSMLDDSFCCVQKKKKTNKLEWNS